MKRNLQRTCTLFLVLVTLLPSDRVHASVFVSLAERLEGGGFPLETDTLAGCLLRGIAAYRAELTVDSARQAEYEYHAWHYYGLIAQYLGESGAPEVIPALIACIRDPFPEALRNDLDLQLPTMTFGATRWKQWDALAEKEIRNFRATCTMALAHIGDRAASAAVSERVERDAADLNALLSSDKNFYLSLKDFRKTCVAATALGDRNAVGELIKLFDYLPKDGSHRAYGDISETLRLCTGQTFGPGRFDIASSRNRHIEHWNSWWNENGANFEIDPERVLQDSRYREVMVRLDKLNRRQNYPDLKLTGPRANLAEALRCQVYPGIRLRAGEMPRLMREVPAYAWLIDHGPRFLNSFRDIANSEDEPSEVRSLAAEFYAQFGGEQALELLKQQAASTTEPSERRYVDFDRSDSAFWTIVNYFPDEVDEVAKDLITRNVDVSGSAANYLTRNAENHNYLIENFFSFSPRARAMILGKLVLARERPDRNILEGCLSGDNLSIAAEAAIGVYSKGLYDSLSDDAKHALTEWEKYPEFLLTLMTRHGLDEKLKEELLAGTGPVSAVANYRVIRIGLKSAENEASTMNSVQRRDENIRTAKENIARNIEVYRNRRRAAGAAAR